MSEPFIGLTWDHPRGRDALRESARLVNRERAEPLVRWDLQPLEGFESAPIAELAAANDLLVLDHPHLGEAIARSCLQPLESLYPAELIQRWAQDSVGPSFDSYRMDGRSWALPLDVAAQVMARRPDRIPEPPTSWEGVHEIAQHLPVALSLGGPHALLTLLSIAVGVGSPVGGEDLLPDTAFGFAFDTLQRLHARQPRDLETLNPIGLLEAMSASDDIALIPFVFGYVTYSIPGAVEHVVAFSDTIGHTRRAGVLGGTGIGVTQRCQATPELLEYLGSLLSTRCQRTLIPAFGGQPSARAAWQDEGVNAAAGHFYRDTLASAENALLRPRFDGWIEFQTRAAAALREALLEGRTPMATLRRMRALWHDARHALPTPEPARRS